MAGEEVSSLLNKAEGHLLEEEFEKASALANQALISARQAADSHGEADSLRLIISCSRVHAQEARYQTDQDLRKQVLAAAEKMASTELGAFRMKGNKRGEASMLLATADMLFEGKRLPETRRGAKKRQEVMSMAQQALSIFQEQGDRPLQAQAWLVIASGNMNLHDSAEALKAADSALLIFRELSDRRGEARALHSITMAISIGPTTKDCYDKGVKATKEAIEIYRSIGANRMRAFQNNFLAKWYLMMDRPRDALGPAKEAMKLFDELGYGKGWQPESRSTVCKAMVGMGDVNGALRIAREGVKLFREAGDRRSEILALENLITVDMEGDAFFETGDLSEALEASETGVERCKEIGDKKWEANMLHNVAQTCLRLKDFDRALKAVTESCTILDDLGEQGDRATTLQTAVGVLMGKGDGRAALEVAGEIRRICKDIGKRSREASAMLLESSIHHGVGNSDKAVDLAMEAQGIFQQVNDKKGEGMAWSFISEVRKSTGQKDEALRASRTTQALYQQAGDKKGQAYAMKTSTALFVAQSSDDEAVRAAHEALALARASGDVRAEVEMLNLVAQATLNAIIKHTADLGDAEAVVYIVKHEDRATRSAREAAALARKLGDKQMTAIATYSVAQCHTVGGRTAASCQAATEARELFSKTWDRQGEALALLLLAESTALDGKMEQGRKLASEAEAMFRELKDDASIAKAVRTLEAMDELMGSSGPVPSTRTSSAPSAAPAAARPAPKAGLSLEKARALAREVAMDAIGGDVDDVLTLDDPLMDVGLDSLAAISFREALSQKSGIPLPASLVFDYPSLHALAMHLVEASEC